MREAKNLKFIPPEIVKPIKNIIKPDEFCILKKLIEEKAGIKLNSFKTVMLESRLSTRLKTLNCSTFFDYINELQQNKNELQEFINALTTNKTDFFREHEHFEYLTTNCLPEILKNNLGKKILVWSAASSTGEEVYTLAISLSEFFKNSSTGNFNILGTDIDTKVLTKAEMGIYPINIVKEIRTDLLRKYFMKGKDENKGLYRISNDLKRNVKFRQFNLLHDELNSSIKFDIIFLRNVLIYFESHTIQIIIDKMQRYLNPGGYLFVGHSETLNNIKHNLKNVGMSIYKFQKPFS